MSLGLVALRFGIATSQLGTGPTRDPREGRAAEAALLGPGAAAGERDSSAATAALRVAAAKRAAQAKFFISMADEIELAFFGRKLTSD